MSMSIALSPYALMTFWYAAASSCAGAGKLQLVAAVAAEGGDDVAAGRAHGVDGLLVDAAGQRAAAVPLRVAVAVAEDEGQCEPLYAVAFMTVVGLGGLPQPL